MNTTYLKVTALVCCAITPLFGADVWALACNKNKLYFDSGSVTVSRDLDNDLSEISVLSKEGISTALPKGELKDIHSPNIQSVRVITTQQKRLNDIASLGDQDFLVIVLKYGETFDVALDGVDAEGLKNTARVTSLVYFVFNRTGYSHRDRRVCQRGSSEWHLYHKSSGMNEVGDGSEPINVQDEAPLSAPSLPVRN